MKYIISIVPLWNFNSSTIDLLSGSQIYEYTIYSDSTVDYTVNLEKIINKNNNGTISEKNILTINDGYSDETDWEDIESIYEFSGSLYICPKGKNHLIKYLDSGLFYEYKPLSLDHVEDWELKCYKQTVKNYLFVAYLNKYEKLFAFKLSSEEWHENQINIGNGIFDFKWTETTNNYREYPMRTLMLSGDKILLRAYIIILETSNDLININHLMEKEIINTFTYSNAFFDSNNDYFYFITYDLNTDNFSSGYYTDRTSFGYDEISSLSPIINNIDSPLQFLYNSTIQKITFVRNTQYVLYEIYNNEKEKTYYGIIDIIANKVIFNTDQEITSFKRFKSISDTTYSFLVITANSAYKICALADNNNCISSCSSGDIYIDSQGKNFCGNKCPVFILVPIGICVEECDLNIFHLVNNYECGFCKDVNSSFPYKLLNSSGCLNNIPYGTYLYNAKYNLLKRNISFFTDAPTTFISTTTLNNIPTTTPVIFSTVFELNKTEENTIISSTVNIFTEEEKRRFIIH